MLSVRPARYSRRPWRSGRAPGSRNVGAAQAICTSEGFSLLSLTPNSQFGKMKQHWRRGQTARLNQDRSHFRFATCVQYKVKVRKAHESGLLRKRSELTLCPAEWPLATRECCTVREWQQCESCRAASERPTSGGFGPEVPVPKIAKQTKCYPNDTHRQMPAQCLACINT